MNLVLIILLIMILGGLPHWGYHQYGYGPSSVGGVLLLVLLILLLMGRL